VAALFGLKYNRLLNLDRIPHEFPREDNPMRRLFRLTTALECLALAGLLAMVACQNSSSPTTSSASKITVTTNPGGPVTIKTSSAEFEVLPSGYVRAYLLKEGKRLTLDDPSASGSLNSVTVNGKEIADFTLDLDHVKVSDARGKLGNLGKRVEITGAGKAENGAAIQESLVFEAYDDFPTLLITSTSYKNLGNSPLTLEKVVADSHQLNASLADPSAPPYQMWSFQGSSEKWGQDDILQISDHFTRQNLISGMQRRGEGGGLPVVAFWTDKVGEAIGHIETIPWVLSLPVGVTVNNRVSASMVLEPGTTLQPGDTYSTPRAFVAVYSGDFYEPLRLYSAALQREGWNLPKPSDADYQISWCGWGYESEVTPKQMLGTIPKLNEMHIRWATLDDRWFDTYGDWNPRSDTFPGDSIQKMVSAFHQQGISVQIWWLPIAVEDGSGGYESHHYKTAQVVKEHPDWLILDKNGKPAKMVRGLGALCPAVPAVQEYYKKLTEKFIRDWGFDGSKLDNVFTIPACYNPKHHHKSPQDSIRAMSEIFKQIFEATRAIKPDSVTQVCPCGTPPNFAWLPYMDQAVTADPVGSIQVRRRIKMYKALLGPQAAVYGDHVELTDIVFKGGDEIDKGSDFASTVGPGGVVGTKFVWPDPGPHFKEVYLTPEKEALWKKWTSIYDQKMLSSGTFLNLYTYGYDVPEGYAISKDGEMYYAFYAPDPATPWQGKLDLRGLDKNSSYKVFDYEHDKDLGTVTGQDPKLTTRFTNHLLLEVSKQ
jgi:alpha-galactosidase